MKNNVQEPLEGTIHYLLETNSFYITEEQQYYICAEFLQSIQQYLSYIDYVHIYAIGETLYIPSNSIFIQLRSGVNIADFLYDNNVPYIRYKRFGTEDGIYLVETNWGGDDIINYTNNLYDTKDVMHAHNNWGIVGIVPDNTYYDNQWGINSLQSFYSINVEQAWTLCDGTGIRVAVIDRGVDLDHPDLGNNVCAGYDAVDPNSGLNGNPQDNTIFHGTFCAGIVAAEDNNIGVKGVAYNSNIIAIRGWVIGQNNTDELADAFNKAWDSLSADVISCSWSCSGNIPWIIRNQIKCAMKYGRGGKGTVVLFSTGNDNSSSISQLAKLPGVIAVGASNINGRRWSNSSSSGSNYGDSLCVVAPGVDIYSTTNHTIGNGYAAYTGTSAACPMVAGVVALMLSANDDLTAKQVKYILGASARKVHRNDPNDPYVYNNRPGYEYGDWNCSVGYGLVDASAAVNMARAMNHSVDLFIKDAPDDYGSEPYMGDYMIGQSPDIVVKDLGGNVVDRVTGGQQYRLEVTVRNRSDERSTGDEYLQVEWAWANAIQLRNVNTQPFNYHCIGADRGFDTIHLPQIDDCSTVVVSKVFTAPSVHTDGCYYAKDFDCPLTFTVWVKDDEIVPGFDRDNVSRDVFVIHNNNAAMKELVLLSDIYDELPIMVQNLRGETSSYSLGYRSFRNSDNNHLTDVAEVKLTLSDGMYQQWLAGNLQSYGLSHISDGIFRVADTVVWFDRISLDPGETEMLTVSVRSSGINSSSDRFDFDVWQQCTSCDECNSFGGTLHTFYQGETDHNIKPIRSISETDSTADNDTITVINKLGTIISINPNPAESEVYVTYQMSDEISSATLAITNAMGAVVRTVATNANGITILNLQGLPSGLYYVQLGTSSEVFDVKTLIVR